MCAQSVQALTVRLRDSAIAGALATAPWAAAGFDMRSQFSGAELKQPDCNYARLVELAEQGAPILLVPKRVP